MRIFVFIGLLFFTLSGFTQDRGGDIINRLKALDVDADDFEIIFHQDLEDTPLGRYTREQWAKDWLNPPWANGIYNGDFTIIEEVDKGGRKSKVMHWTFPEGTYGAHSKHGYQWQTPFGGKHEEIYLTYSIMFRPNFEPVQGGKIPGLMASPKESGPPLWEHGYGGSLMWVAGDGPRPIFYTYHQDQPGSHGDLKGFGYNFDVSTDIWYDVTLRVVMNTATATEIGGPDGLFDGLEEGFVNGTLYGQWGDLRLRNLSSIGTDRVRIQAFFGGGSSDWAAARDEWMLIDNVFIWKYSDKYLEENPDVKRGHQKNPWKGKIATPMDVDFSGEIVNPDPGDHEPPTVPEGLVALDSTSSTIQVSWDASEDNEGVTSYTVYVDDLADKPTPETQYTVTDLEASQLYAVSVSARDAEDNTSAKSSNIYVRTLNADTDPPTTPTGLSISGVTGYSMVLSWQASFDNVSVIKYEIFVDGSSIGESHSTTYKITDLQPNTEYALSLRAYDPTGNMSPISSSIRQTTNDPDTEFPSVPGGLRAVEVTEKTISLEWDPSTDNIGVEEYYVYVSNELREETSQPRETVAQLSPGLTYNISISALDEAENESAQSDPLEVTTINEDITTTPEFPRVNITSVQNNTIKPNSLTDIESYGFTELKNYGLEVTQSDSVGIDPIILKGTTSSESMIKDRVTEGLLALYNFSEGTGNEVKDVSDVGTPLNLKIKHEGIATQWLVGQGLELFGNTILEYDGSPDKLIEEISNTNEITMEAWVKQQYIDQSGPARIMTLSEGNSGRAATLGHEGNKSFFNYIARLNTSSTDPNGSPELTTEFDFLSESLHHVVYTRNSEGSEKIYVNGWEMAEGTKTGNFSSWEDDYKFALGNEISQERPWKGILFLAAVYNSALSKEDVLRNFDAGLGPIRFDIQLDTLQPNVNYTLTPFVSTDQGIVFGDPKDFLYQNVTLTDSIFTFYPNPSNGSFSLLIKNQDEDVKLAQLRITDLAGQVHFNAELDLSEGLIENEFSIQLPASMQNGFYSMMLIAGPRTIAQKFVLIK